MPPVDLDWGSEDDWGSGLDWDAVDREASKRLKLTQGHAQELQVGTGARQSARPLDAPNQQPAVNVDAVQQQQIHQQQQPMPISSLSVRQLFIKRHMPGGHQQQLTSTSGTAAWGQQWRQQRESGYFTAGESEPSRAFGKLGMQASVIRHPLTHSDSCHGKLQRPAPSSDARGRIPLTDKQQRLPAAPAPLQKPHRPQIGQQRSPPPVDITRLGVPTPQQPGAPCSSIGQRCGQQASEAPQVAGSASVRLPHVFPAPLVPAAGRESGASNRCQQGSGPGRTLKPSSTITPDRMGPQQPASSWPQYSGITQQQQQEQQQFLKRPGTREVDASKSRQPPPPQQSLNTFDSTAVNASANPRHAPSESLAATRGREPRFAEAQRKQQAHMGSAAARSAQDAAMEEEEDFVLPLPKRARMVGGPQSASAPAAGRPAAAPDAIRAAISTPAASSGQGPPRAAETQAAASGRALPASMAGAAAAAPGPKAGEGPVTRALLKIGPGSSLEVGIGNYPALTAALKQLGEGSFSRFEGGQSVWRFPLASHQAVCAALEGARGVRCSVEDLHPVPRAFLEAAVALLDESARYERIPAKLEERLMAFQRDGVRFALRHGGRALIGDEMGLGKTVQALALMAAFKDEWPCLIIVPSSLREQWVEALVEWLGITEDQVHVTNCRKDTDLTGRRFKCLIASYNFLGNLEASDRDLNFGIVIMDEAHYIKNKKSCRSQDAKPFVQKAKRAILLSGTPASGRPRELFPLIECLLPASKVSFTKFGERYCLMQNNYARGKSFYGSKYDGTSNPDELNRVLTSSIMVRRLKKDVLSQLPPKRRTQVFLQLDADAKKQLDGMQKEINVVKAAVEGADSEAVLERVSQQVKTTILDLYYRNAKLKIKAVQEYLKELLESTDQKLLVFAHHKDLLDGIEFIMNKTKQRYIRIDGSVKTNSRQDLVNNFQNDRDIRAAVLSIHAAGTGLTLTGASVVVFAEYSWIPGNLRQAEDRAHRIGQTTSVNVYYLHVRSSVDDIMWAKIQSKLENVGQVLDGKEDMLALAATHNQVTGDQRSLRGFLQPSQTSGRPACAAPLRDDDFQTPPLPPQGSAAHHAGGMPPPSNHPMTHQHSQRPQPPRHNPESSGGGIGRQGDMRAFLVPRGGP